MDKEFIMATAKTIEQQILWSINKWEYLSWGISKKAAVEFDGMATLALRVSGAVHKGWVFISLNEGMDCYEVRLLNVARTKVKRTLEEVYCDNLGEVLDGLIERKTEWTDEQYKNKAARDSARKMGMDVMGVSKPKIEKTMTNEVKFRPATMAEIEGRDTDLYMDGEQVWVMMICRSETIGEGEAKLDYIMLTNMKKVQVEDLQVIDNNNNEPKEDKTMATVEMKNESNNVQTAAQVINAAIKREQSGAGSGYAEREQGRPKGNPSNEAIEDVNVGEVTVDSIMPVMQPVVGSEYTVESDGKTATFESVAPNIGSEEKPAVTMPLGDHGTLVVGGVPKAASKREQSGVGSSSAEREQARPEVKRDKDGKFMKKSEDKPKSTLPLVRLVIYTTKRGEQAPRIEGFSGENDPRWKRHYDDKARLAKEKKEADAFNEKLTEKMKGKPKAEREKLRKQWKSVGSDPFGASYFTDRTTGDKYYQMTMGAKYMEVARELVDAYNSGDEQAIAAAEQAVIDCKNGIVKNIEAQRDAKRAEREAAKAQEKPAKPATGYSDQDVADMLRKVLAGGDVPENIKKLLQAA